MQFFLALVIRCPEILHSCVVAKDAGFDPLTFAGVVTDDGTVAATTELPLAMTFNTPYKTLEGGQILFTVGMGKNVSVNCLVGVPFLKGAKATIDLEAERMTTPVFKDFLGWKLLYHRPSVTMPPC